MPTTSTCPQTSDLQKLAAGRLPAEEMEALTQHLERCPICLANVQTLCPADTLAIVLAKAAPPTYGSDEAIITRLVERLSKLGQTNGPAAASKTLTFVCTGCGKNLKVKGELAGKKVKCPGCGKSTAAPPARAADPTAPLQPLSEAKTMLPAADNSEQKTALPSNGDTTNGATIDQPRKPEATQAFGGARHVDEELWDFLAPAEQPDEIGRLGGYRVLKVLGAGGMGVVFRAEDPNLKRPVALKAMLPSLAASPSAKKRFMREARAAAALKHDHIVAIYQVGEDRGAPFLAMEFLDGEPLDKCLHRDTKLPLADVLRIGREIAQGLAAAHDKGLIHRDIKPANIWLETNPNRARDPVAPPRVKILDFGLARAAAEESGLTRQGAVLGTPAYMAPEQARGAPVDSRCDLFSLGVVLYRMCTGKQPFLGNDTVSTLMAVATHEPPAPALVDPELPPELSDLVMKLLEKNVDQRLASANDAVEILQGLEKALARGEPSPVRGRVKEHDTVPLNDKASKHAATPKERAAQPPTPPRRKRGMIVGAVAVVMLGGLALLAGGIVYYVQTDNGIVRIEINDPKIKVTFDKTSQTIAGVDKHDIKISAGQHGLYVERDGLDFHTEKFMLKRGETITLQIDWLPEGKLQVVQAGKVIKEKSLPPFAQPPNTSASKFALEFDGMNSRVVVPSWKYMGDHPLTLEAWAILQRPADDKRKDTLMSSANSSGLFIDSDVNKSGKWGFAMHFASYLSANATGALPRQRLVHLAGVYDGKAELRFYIDGKLQNRSTVSGKFRPAKDVPFTLGADPYADGHFEDFFQGLLHEVRISKTTRYDKDFTPAQRFEPGADTLALYHCDEGAGAVLKDSSGNNHHGKIVGAKWVNADGAPIGPQARQVAEKGVLDYAEIHDADEKRFDAWIAQLPKDGFRPVSLSIQVVKDVPRYTAVAVKEEKKSVWEFRRPPSGKEIAQIEEMWAKNYSAFIQNPFNQEGKERAVVVWLWNATRTAMWTGDRVFIDIKIAEDAPNKVRPIYRSANEHEGRINYAILMGPDDGTPLNDFINLPLDECKALVEKHKADGWRPKNLYTYGAGAKRLFGVTLVQEKDRPAWDISWSLTPAQYEAELLARKKQGFRPHSSVGHEHDAGNVRFSVVWILYRSENSPAPVTPPAKQSAEQGVHDYAEIHDADEKRFDAWLAQLKKDGFRPGRLTVQTVKDAPRYTAVALKEDKNWPWEFSRANKGADNHADKYWKKKFEAVAHAFFRDKGQSREAFLWAKDESLDNDGYWLGDATFIEAKIKAARADKVRLISRSAGFEGNAAEFGIILESADGVPWQESYNLLFDDMKAYVEKHKADGWRPDHFCYYGVGAKRLFGAILIKDPNKADWDVSWSIAPAEYDKELSARKAQGFRPLTAVGHEDNAGALRFSVIWIRYRNLNARAVRAPDMSKLKALHDDRFDNPKSGFPHDLKDPDYPAGYVNGKYSIKGGPNGYRSCGNQLYSNFACQVTGRLRNADSGRWGLNIFADGPRHGISVTINWDGKLSIKPEPADVVQDRGPKIGPIVHPAIKKGEENTLLVIVRGREVEVYVNSVLMCDPFVVDRDITPAWVSMGAFGGKGGVEAEFTRYTIWSAEGLPKVSAP